jgi:hypothetical protein
MTEPNYDSIRSRVAKRFERRVQFFTNLITFIVINVAVWSFDMRLPFSISEPVGVAIDMVKCRRKPSCVKSSANANSNLRGCSTNETTVCLTMAKS